MNTPKNLVLLKGKEMGYSVYEDETAKGLGVERWAGYGVPAKCDHPDCNKKIDRGMSYRCEEYTSHKYLDEDGSEVPEDSDWEHEIEEEMEGCLLFFCDDHGQHGISHADGVKPKLDTRKWAKHLLADETWAEWREINPITVEGLEKRLAAKK